MRMTSELQTSFFFEDANTPTMTAHSMRLNPKATEIFGRSERILTKPAMSACPTPLGRIRQTTSRPLLRAGDQQYGSSDFEKDADY